MSFKAGRLGQYKNEWKKLTSDKLILSWLKGYKIPFVSEVVQIQPPKETVWSTSEIQIISKELDRLLALGFIRQGKPAAGQFLSSIFVVPKSDGSFRLILNIKKLNCFLRTEHFKLEDEKAVRRIICPDDYLSTLDLKDAYHLIPVDEDDRKFLRFRFLGVIYEYTCMPSQQKDINRISIRYQTWT